MNLSPAIIKSVAKLCRQFHVERLYLFGSAVDGRFDSNQSDLDFLVTLQPQGRGEYADNYLGLARSLEKLFGRPVDLVTESAIRNRYFRESVRAGRQLLYDHRDEEAIA